MVGAGLLRAVLIRTLPLFYVLAINQPHAPLFDMSTLRQLDLHTRIVLVVTLVIGQLFFLYNCYTEVQYSGKPTDTSEHTNTVRRQGFGSTSTLRSESEYTEYVNWEDNHNLSKQNTGVQPLYRSANSANEEVQNDGNLFNNDGENENRRNIMSNDDSLVSESPSPHFLRTALIKTLPLFYVLAINSPPVPAFDMLTLQQLLQVTVFDIPLPHIVLGVSLVTVLLFSFYKIIQFWRKPADMVVTTSTIKRQGFGWNNKFRSESEYANSENEEAQNEDQIFDNSSGNETGIHMVLNDVIGSTESSTSTVSDSESSTEGDYSIGGMITQRRFTVKIPKKDDKPKRTVTENTSEFQQIKKKTKEAIQTPMIDAMIEGSYLHFDTPYFNFDFLYSPDPITESKATNHEKVAQLSVLESETKRILTQNMVTIKYEDTTPEDSAETPLTLCKSSSINYTGILSDVTQEQAPTTEAQPDILPDAQPTEVPVDSLAWTEALLKELESLKAQRRQVRKDIKSFEKAWRKAGKVFNREEGPFEMLKRQREASIFDKLAVLETAFRNSNKNDMSIDFLMNT